MFYLDSSPHLLAWEHTFLGLALVANSSGVLGGGGPFFARLINSNGVQLIAGGCIEPSPTIERVVSGKKLE